MLIFNYFMNQRSKISAKSAYSTNIKIPIPIVLSLLSDNEAFLWVAFPFIRTDYFNKAIKIWRFSIKVTKISLRHTP